jgi:N-acetylneuraminic acid mutarotase
MVLSRFLDKNPLIGDSPVSIMGISMSRSVAPLLVLVFLIVSGVIIFPSVSAASANSWASKASMPQGKSSFGIAVMDGKIYAIGGCIRNYVSSWTEGLSGTIEAVNTNYEYDPALDRWISEPPMPTPRYNFATVVYEDSIYCIGGLQNVFRNGHSVEVGTAAVEAFNFSTNKWENKTPITTPRDSFATIVYKDNIYCIGGGINEVYNIATDTWQNEAPTPFNGSIVTANVVNGKLYLTSDSLLYVYNPATNSWISKASAQTENYGNVSAVIDNKIYFISASSTQIYDTETDTVSLGASPLPDHVVGVALATTGEIAPEQIYVFGVGTKLQVSLTQVVTVQVYDPEADSWSVGTNMPTVHVNVGFAVVNEKIYAIGGNSVTTSPGVYPAYPDVHVTQYATNEQYTPFGYGTIPPVISVILSENQTYSEADVPLVFSVNKPVIWIGYSLDGQDNVTVVDNAIMTGLSDGVHNVTVYAKDSFGNVGVSDAASFIVAVNVPFPTVFVFVAVASGSSATIIATGLLVYFKKRPH